jgi:molecular chaperone DnaK (HSP70)
MDCSCFTKTEIFARWSIVMAFLRSLLFQSAIRSTSYRRSLEPCAESRDARRRLPYKVLHQGNQGEGAVPFSGATGLYSPEEISTTILTKMKTITDDFLVRAVKNALVPVPFYFNDADGTPTIHAGASLAPSHAFTCTESSTSQAPHP